MIYLKYHNKVARQEVVSEWAKRERVTTGQLLINRAPLLNALPPDTVWFKVSINKNDLGSLKVINGDDSWLFVSDNAGEIKRIAQNLPILSKNPPQVRHSLMPDGRTFQEYVNDRIGRLQEFRNSVWDEGHNLTLVLISSTRQGPFTILEGNHTAVGLYFKYFIDNPKLPYPPHDSYVGVSPHMNKCCWYWAS